MPGSARLTDLFSGVCVCHDPPIPMTGVIITGSPNTNVNELLDARLTDVVLGDCGHTGVISSASPNTNTNELGSARLGDSVTGCLVGVIVSASSDVFVN